MFDNNKGCFEILIQKSRRIGNPYIHPLHVKHYGKREELTGGGKTSHKQEGKPVQSTTFKCASGRRKRCPCEFGNSKQ